MRQTTAVQTSTVFPNKWDVSEVTNAFNSTLIVSKQPCSSARTVTMSSMQPENNRDTATWGQKHSAPLHISNNNSVLLHSPKVKMNFSLSLISMFCSSRLPCKWESQELETTATIIGTEESETRQNFWWNVCLIHMRLLTAHNSKSRTPRDQTSVLGPEGSGASSWEESLGWKEPWAITSGARYDG